MKVFLPSSLRTFTGGVAVVEESAATVGALMDRLDTRFPGIKERLCDPDGGIKRFVHVFVNGQDIRNLQGAHTVLTNTDEVKIVPAMAGG